MEHMKGSAGFNVHGAVAQELSAGTSCQREISSACVSREHDRRQGSGPAEPLRGENHVCDVCAARLALEGTHTLPQSVCNSSFLCSKRAGAAAMEGANR